MQGALDKLERVVNGTLNTPFHQIDNEVRGLSDVSLTYEDCCKDAA